MGLYSKIENVAFWARSEKIGCALDISRGMMEYWSDGLLGLVERDLILSGWHGPENKSRPSSAFNSQSSIIPPFQYSMGYLTADSTPLSEL
jgi:hypothetical protein